MRYSSIATNLFNLFIVLFILLGSMELARRGTLIGLLFWPAYCSLLPVTFIRMNYEKLTGDRLGESSETIRICMQTVCEFQLERFSNSKLVNMCNADMRVWGMRQLCKLQADGQNLIRARTSRMNLSTRAYNCILKLARTIAGLLESEEIRSAHVAEAFNIVRNW